MMFMIRFVIGDISNMAVSLLAWLNKIIPEMVKWIKKLSKISEICFYSYSLQCANLSYLGRW